MNDENELLEPLATEAGQEAIVRAIRDISSLEYAVRAEQAASTASAKAGEASQSAIEASEAEDNAKDWATKTDGYVEQETITIPPTQEGEEPTTETINLYSARYYAALAQDIFNNMSFDSVPTENSNNMVSSGVVYSALDLKADKSTTYTKTETDNLINTRLAELVASAPAALDTLQELATALGNDPNFATTIATQLGNKADKSDTYTKTEVDTALSNVQSTLTFDNVPTANSDNPVKSSGIKTALDGKQNTLTFDSTPTANSNNPVTSGGIYTALQNVNIDIDDEITEDSDNPVTSAAIYEALQNFTPSGGGGGAGNASGVIREELWSGQWSSGNITLSNSLLDYDLLEFWTNNPSNNNYYAWGQPKLISPKEIIKTNSDNPIEITGESGRYFAFYYSSNTQLTYKSKNTNECRCIYGIKFSKNLSEQMYSNVLYENASGITSGTFTLTDDWNNYDFVSFEIWNGSSGAKNQQFFAKEFLENCYTDSKNLIVIRYTTSQVTLKPTTNYKTFTIDNSSDNGKIYKIIGYKMAKGGYSGIVSDARMTVKSGTIDTSSGISTGRHDYNVTFDSPMPDANYNILFQQYGFRDYYNQFEITVTNKTVNGFSIAAFQLGGNQPSLQDAHIDWIAIRPNSYTREGMVEDVLFSSENGVYNTTINLSGNISDYDLIQFITRRSGASNSQNTNVNTFVASELPNLTETGALGKCIFLTGFDQDYQKIAYVNDNTLNCYEVYALKLYKVIGIKFGRYVSGVAVDTTVTQNSDAVVTSGAVYDALQNISSGGGSSITIDSTITQNSTNPVESAAIYTALAGKQNTLTIDSSVTQSSTNPVQSGAVYTALGNKADTSTTLSGYGITDAYTKTEVDTALSSKGDVTTNTDQNITGTKTFVGSKKVGFKQSTANDKLGFTLYGNTGTERGYLEFNPTNTIDGVAGLMTLGNYATSAAALTQVGFRRYSNISGANGAYNLLTPLIADAKTPFSLTTTYTNFYLPLGFTDGTTTVRTAKSGLVDLSPLLASLEARIAALEGN